MPDRAHINEVTQIGLEVTPGTSVIANKLLTSTSFTLGVEGEADAFRPDGHKWNSLVAPNTEWTSFRIEGRPTYTEMPYLLESICGAPVTTAAGTTGKKRVYTISDIAADTPKTFTIEKGSAVRASKLTYGLVTEMGMVFGRRNGVTLTGAGIGQLLTDGVTLTPTPTALPLVPILGRQLDVYIDPTSATLGTTKMLRAFAVEPAIGNKYGPVWPINSTVPSWAGHVELVPTGTLRIRLEADAAGMAYLSQYRTGGLIFMSVKAIGPIYEAAFANEFTWEAALGIRRITDFGADEDGVTIVQYETEFVQDATWNKAMQITVQNGVGTL